MEELKEFVVRDPAVEGAGRWWHRPSYVLAMMAWSSFVALVWLAVLDVVLVGEAWVPGGLFFVLGFVASAVGLGNERRTG